MCPNEEDANVIYVQQDIKITALKKRENCNEEKVLGLNRNPKKDKIIYKVKLNFSKKFRNVQESPCQTKADLESGVPKISTKKVQKSGCCCD